MGDVTTLCTPFGLSLSHADRGCWETEPFFVVRLAIALVTRMSCVKLSKPATKVSPSPSSTEDSPDTDSATGNR